MTLPSIVMPLGIAGLIKTESQRIEKDDVYASVGRGIGHTRRRRVKTDAERTTDFETKLLTQVQATALDEWFENALKQGERSFSLEMTKLGSGMVWWEAFFVEPPVAEPKDGGWIYTGKLRLINQAVTESPLVGDAEVNFTAPFLGTASLFYTLDGEIAFTVPFEPTTEAEIAFSVPFLLTGDLVPNTEGEVAFACAFETAEYEETGTVFISLTMPTADFDVAGSPAGDGDTFAVTWKNQAANTVLAGPDSGPAATPSFRLLLDLLDDVFGTTQGSVLYHNGSSWVSLGPGTAGDVLTTNGAAANPTWETPSGGPGGGGSTKVEKTAAALGTQAASQSAFTYYTVASTCKRGLVSQILITASTYGSFDLCVRGDDADSGTLWLQATSVSALTYLVTLPWYYENDAAGQDFFIGIKNTGAVSQTYTLTYLRVEKFA